MAADLGKKLLAHVEEEGLNEILSELHFHQESRPVYFGLEPFDTLIRQMFESRSISSPTTPVIELASISPGQGKTHLLYHLISLAVLPSFLGGQHATVVFFDTSNSVSVRRLATQIRLLATANSATSLSATDIDTTVRYALRHVHIFRPQTLNSLIATLETLPAYLFDSTSHYSIDRKLAFVAIDSVSTFYWTSRAASLDQSPQAPSYEPRNESSTTDRTPSKAGTKPTSKPTTTPLTALYNHLATVLQTTSKIFGSCPVIYTAQPTNLSLAPTTSSSSTSATIPTHNFNRQFLRVGIPGVLGDMSNTSIPPSASIDNYGSNSLEHNRAVRKDQGQGAAILRLISRRIEVPKFPARFSVEEALREKTVRQRAVEQGRFEVAVNGWGLSADETRRVWEGEMTGFGFRVKGEGVVMDSSGGESEDEEDRDG